MNKMCNIHKLPTKTTEIIEDIIESVTVIIHFHSYRVLLENGT